MGFALQQQVTLETIECYKCAVLFAMPDRMMRERRNNGGDFYCPNGHRQHFMKTEVQRLREKLDEQTCMATQMADRARLAEVAEKSHRDALTKLRKRTQAGVCPCCHRTFSQLAKHMKQKHADYE